MNWTLNPRQLEILAWINEGCPGSDIDNGMKVSARALATRRLATVRGRGSTWHAKITEAGEHYLEHGVYPPEHQGEKSVAKPTPAEPIKHDVDSPAGMRESGRMPKGDALFDAASPDPWDERILVTVKEAAWLLSLTEHAIRDAARNGDLDRVFIGSGRTHYRIVYGSLLGWVNDMPRESTHQSWWRR